jgi:hypothetical protein
VSSSSSRLRHQHWRGSAVRYHPAADGAALAWHFAVRLPACIQVKQGRRQAGPRRAMTPSCPVAWITASRRRRGVLAAGNVGNAAQQSWDHACLTRRR